MVYAGLEIRVADCWESRATFENAALAGAGLKVEAETFPVDVAAGEAGSVVGDGVGFALAAA